ncbi:hypothetical protein D3880_04785 [Pseudomonas cavernae]|uniref:Uncharacterized protein n=1 Tax=Pseudomonas cavernae TaxID=2320867 RepID=A0A385YZJ9_9PSED|nr:hypothetical protein [Pseudomonas cavernae]AYC31740.1 hypothetical protein D3880_04785 [Pseudomonas cavernae]
MSLLQLLFRRPHPMRSYALLDAQGICRALRQSRTAPPGSDWVAVGECRLAWLQRPLPANARPQPASPPPPQRAPLTA